MEYKRSVTRGGARGGLGGYSPPRTEIQGRPGGPWPPQKFSIVVAVNLHSFIQNIR